MDEINNVSTTSKVVKNTDAVQPLELGSFVNNTATNQTEQMAKVATLKEKKEEDISQKVLQEIMNIQTHIRNVEAKVTSIENDAVKGKDLDQQLIQALKDLKNYSSFFEQAAFQFENKLLKTSLSIAQKIIGIEVSQNSSQIAMETIKSMLDKIKQSSKVSIHLNPKDHMVVQNQVTFEAHVTLIEDANVAPGGVVIASDLGNFDGNVEAKVNTMLEALDGVV
ncbi:MAG: FliH/SctL family protein [Campylobacterota bacterium]|nr:FliH/SctL family protein [Campylobacterota bacterium]